MKSLTLSFVRVRLVIVVAALNIVLAVMGWMLLVSPQRHHAVTAAQQLQQAQAELGTLGAPQTTQPQLPSTPQEGTKEIYGPLAHAMPTTIDEPDLLLELDRLARGTGVRVLGLSPQTPTEAVGYTIVPITLSLGGGYSALTGYLSRLRTLVSVRHGNLVARGRLLSVTAVTYTPGVSGKALTATVSVDAFVYGILPGATPLPTVTDTTSTGTDTTGTSTTTTTSGQ